MTTAKISECLLQDLPWHQLQHLLDTCYPRPPRDVFQLVVSASHQSQRVWLALDGESLVGVVMLSPHSKGGHLENLAVLPSGRGRGVAHLLVTRLLQSLCHTGPAMVTLTTRIPEFFSKFGFVHSGQLADGSIAMTLLLPSSSISEVSDQ